jgi:hypothetical protein
MFSPVSIHNPGSFSSQMRPRKNACEDGQEPQHHGMSRRVLDMASLSVVFDLSMCTQRSSLPPMPSPTRVRHIGVPGDEDKNSAHPLQASLC